MPDAAKTGIVGAIGGVVLGLSLGVGVLAPDKADILSDITVSEALSSKADTVTMYVETKDEVREAQTVDVISIDEDGDTIITGKQDLPRVVVRPENTMRILDIPAGDTVRVAVFCGEKNVAQWATVISEPPDPGKVTRASIQIVLYDQVQ